MISNMPYRFQVISDIGGYIDGFRGRKEADQLVEWIAEKPEHDRITIYDHARKEVVFVLERKEVAR